MKEDLKGGFQPSFRLEYNSLSPEEREKALGVAREVVAEAKILLGNQYSIHRMGPKDGRYLTILGNQPEEVIIPLDSELTIATFQYKGIGHDRQFEFHLYAFHSDQVNHSISYTKTEGERINEQRQVREANAEDLIKLLQDIKDSRPRKE